MHKKCSDIKEDKWSVQVMCVEAAKINQRVHLGPLCILVIAQLSSVTWVTETDADAAVEAKVWKW